MKRIALCIFLICSVALWSVDDKKTEKTTKTTTTTTTTAKSSATEDAIKKMEHDMWEAWKNHDNKVFENNLADDAVVLDDPANGFQDKKTLLSKMGDPSMQCDVKSYSFENEKITWVDKDAAIYTYTANVDATCAGQKVPDKVAASSVWAKRGSKWLGLMHQETFAMPPMAGEKKSE